MKMSFAVRCLVSCCVAAMLLLAPIIAHGAEPGRPALPEPFSAEQLLWELELGNHQYTVPRIDRGQIFIGANDQNIDHPAIDGDRLFLVGLRGDVLCVYFCTSNGQDHRHANMVHPDAPSLIAVEKATGRLVATDDEPISANTFHGQWSSPVAAEFDGRPLPYSGWRVSSHVIRSRSRFHSAI